MRTATGGPVTPLLGSLGLHGGLVLALWIAVRPAAVAPAIQHERPDAWQGNTVEVDAVATPDTTASLPSAAQMSAATQTNAVPEPAATKPVAPDVKPTEATPDHPAPRFPARTPPLRPRATSPARRTPTATNQTATAHAADPGSAAGAAAPATGAFGAEGLAPGVRSLPRAFTRAIPAAAGADPIWQNLPGGSERPFTIAIDVDEDGHISRAEVIEEKSGSPAPMQASHLRERVVALLGGGLFALQNNTGAGRALFRITITLSDRPVQNENAPAELVERGFEPPIGSEPGRAYFTLATGRHFEAKVEILNRP